jgi:hypothetical protein
MPLANRVMANAVARVMMIDGMAGYRRLNSHPAKTCCRPLEAVCLSAITGYKLARSGARRLG